MKLDRFESFNKAEIIKNGNVNLNNISLDEKQLTDDAKEFISDKIAKLKEEGYEGKQAVAIAYSYAKKAGYDVGKNPNEAETGDYPAPKYVVKPYDKEDEEKIKKINEDENATKELTNIIYDTLMNNKQNPQFNTDLVDDPMVDNKTNTINFAYNGKFYDVTITVSKDQGY